MADKKRDKSNKPSDTKINRRDFINLVGKAALPTIAFLSLGRIGDLIAKPGKGNENHEEPAKNPTDCILSCEGGCRTSCEGECRGTCENACFLTCEGSCKYNCEGGCTGSCEGMCKGTCEGGCSGGAW